MSSSIDGSSINPSADTVNSTSADSANLSGISDTSVAEEEVLSGGISGTLDVLDNSGTGDVSNPSADTVNSTSGSSANVSGSSDTSVAEGEELGGGIYDAIDTVDNSGDSADVSDLTNTASTTDSDIVALDFPISALKYGFDDVILMLLNAVDMLSALQIDWENVAKSDGAIALYNKLSSYITRFFEDNGGVLSTNVVDALDNVNSLSRQHRIVDAKLEALDLALRDLMDGSSINPRDSRYDVYVQTDEADGDTVMQEKIDYTVPDNLNDVSAEISRLNEESADVSESLDDARDAANTILAGLTPLILLSVNAGASDNPIKKSVKIEEDKAISIFEGIVADASMLLKKIISDGIDNAEGLISASVDNGDKAKYFAALDIIKKLIANEGGQGLSIASLFSSADEFSGGIFAIEDGQAKGFLQLLDVYKKLVVEHGGTELANVLEDAKTVLVAKYLLEQVINAVSSNEIDALKQYKKAVLEKFKDTKRLEESSKSDISISEPQQTVSDTTSSIDGSGEDEQSSKLEDNNDVPVQDDLSKRLLRALGEYKQILPNAKLLLAVASGTEFKSDNIGKSEIYRRLNQYALEKFQNVDREVLIKDLANVLGELSSSQVQSKSQAGIQQEMVASKVISSRDKLYSLGKMIDVFDINNMAVAILTLSNQLKEKVTTPVRVPADKQEGHLIEECSNHLREVKFTVVLALTHALGAELLDYMVQQGREQVAQRHIEE